MSKNEPLGNREAKKANRDKSTAPPAATSGAPWSAIEKLRARGLSRTVRGAVAPAHRFGVGVYVAYRQGPGSGLYRVTRLLPDEGQGLQYRVRSDRDGQERVVLEAALQRAM